MIDFMKSSTVKHFQKQRSIQRSRAQMCSVNASPSFIKTLTDIKISFLPRPLIPGCRYCQLHHMLLQLAQEYPVIQESIDRALSRFQSRPSARNKTQTPDLGELLVLLSVAKTGGVTWASLAEAFVSETFERCAHWAVSILG
jgi:hypothetical protein